MTEGKGRRGVAIWALCLLITICFGMSDPPERGEPLDVMSFNIRYGTARDGENAWPKRSELVFRVMRDGEADVIGLQEALKFQLDEVLEALPTYGFVGVGRSDGVAAGEYAAILYRRERIEVVEQGTFWFSETPDEPGSTSYGNSIPRICTWARFRDRTNGELFHFCNVHFDHQSQPSREKSAEMLRAHVEQRADGEPVIVMGDFNAGETNKAMRILRGAGDTRLVDTFRAIHADDENDGTFNGFTGKTDGERIDSILVDPSWTIEGAEIDHTNDEGRWPSDHCPVTATLRWPASGED